jgi:hypothetical protein
LHSRIVVAIKVYIKGTEGNLKIQYEYMVGKDNINLLSPEHLVKGLRIYLFPELYIIGIIASWSQDFLVRRRNPEPSEPIIIALGVLKSI